jgi:hypothetical protein
VEAAGIVLAMGKVPGDQPRKTPLIRQHVLSRAFRLKTRRTIKLGRRKREIEKGVRTSGVVAGGFSKGGGIPQAPPGARI